MDLSKFRINFCDFSESLSKSWILMSINTCVLFNCLSSPKTVIVLKTEDVKILIKWCYSTHKDETAIN